MFLEILKIMGLLLRHVLIYLRKKVDFEQNIPEVTIQDSIHIDR